MRRKAETYFGGYIKGNAAQLAAAAFASHLHGNNYFAEFYSKATVRRLSVDILFGYHKKENYNGYRK